ncbi:MAG TPA: hypothetical protein VN258_08555 [Mobilitalea sp.]|nr:hypothetical protein [Mobilitalea sp.]
MTFENEPIMEHDKSDVTRLLAYESSNIRYVWCNFKRYRRWIRNLEAAQAIGMDTVLFNSRKVEYDGKIVTEFKELANILISE